MSRRSAESESDGKAFNRFAIENFFNPPPEEARSGEFHRFQSGSGECPLRVSSGVRGREGGFYTSI